MLHKFFCASTHLSNFNQSEHKSWTWSVTNTWPWKERVFPACILKKLAGFLRLRSVWNQNRNSVGRYWHKHNIFDMNLKKVNVSLRSFKKGVNCQRKTLKNTRSWWVDTWARDTARWYWSADTLFWQLSIDDNIDVQSAFSWAPKVARKCESKHWYACGADGRSVGRSVGRSRDYQIFWDG